jgi:putative heme-binding domain-containing protein
MQEQDHSPSTQRVDAIGCEYIAASVGCLRQIGYLRQRAKHGSGFLLLFMFMFVFASAACDQGVYAQSEPVKDSSEFSQARLDSLVALAAERGDFDRGLRVFTNAKSACFSCHRIMESEPAIGPQLAAISKQRTPVQLAESLLWPNRAILPEFQPIKVATVSGEQFTGYLSETESTDSTLVLKDPATRALTKVPRNEIETQANGLSLMPNGLVDSLHEQDQADLLSFLIGLGTKPDLDLPAVQAIVRSANTHEPASFAYERGPLRPEIHPLSKEFVNRDRIYDYYSKQADHFTRQAARPKLLAPFPGLDGPNFGHWGNQNEEYWKGEELNQSVQGLVQCGVLATGAKPIPRAVCFRLGPNRTWSACFNPDTFAYEKFWTGGFVRYSSVRHGLMDGIRISGRELPLPPEARSVREWIPELAKANIEYRGYYIHGDQVLFSYFANGKEYIDAAVISGRTLKRMVAPKDSHPLRSLLSGGPKRATQTIETPITLGKGNGFAIDTISLPVNNPWKAVLYCGDHAFMSDGSAIVATVQGDVWRVRGVAYESANPSRTARWSRIASGLHQALGVVVDEDRIYVLGRNQITRLGDLNGDGETDWYECFSNAFKTSPGGHDYICGLQRDPQGRFFIASGNEGIVQISADGKNAQVIANGFRNPDGFGLLPDGTFTVPASEGDWTPTSMIYQVRPKRIQPNGAAEYETSPVPFYGHRGPKDGREIELPLVYLPRGLDNSSGGQTWVDDKRMGPLNGHIVHTSYGAGQAFLVLRDQVGERWQGAVVPLPGDYRSGVHRIRINKADGCLYLSGMNGWGSYTPDPGCFQRLRYTGEDIQLPIGFHIHRNGIAVRFRKPIRSEVAQRASAQFAQCWNYRYSPGYGSKEYSVLHPPMIGHDLLGIAGSHILDDGTTLFLEIPDLQLCSQIHLRLQLGDNDSHELFATVHAMDSDRTDLPSYKANENKAVLVHPMVRDLEWLKRSVPNPWSKKFSDGRELRIASRDNLQFSTKTLEAVAGERIKLTFENPDVVPHNWALIRPGTLAKIGDMTNRLVNDPDAYLRHYVPESDDVICYTDIVNPKDESTIYFVAPKEPGRYPFLCTFPGHWMVMNGDLVVKAPK